eukprot:Filipodium_phascolosomae@DN5770_c0_g1_i1.p2
MRGKLQHKVTSLTEELHTKEKHPASPSKTTSDRLKNSTKTCKGETLNKSIVCLAAAQQHEDIDAAGSSSATPAAPDPQQENSEIILPDGSLQTVYSNGLKKINWPDGKMTVQFQNGDTKETLKDSTVVYHYAETDTWQTSYVD